MSTVAPQRVQRVMVYRLADVDFAYLWLAIGIMYGVLARRPAS